VTNKKTGQEIAQSLDSQSEDALAIFIGMRMQSLSGMDVLFAHDQAMLDATHLEPSISEGHL
jgi:hypothetical protein